MKKGTIKKTIGGRVVTWGLLAIVIAQLHGLSTETDREEVHCISGLQNYGLHGAGVDGPGTAEVKALMDELEVETYCGINKGV